jgi:DNA-binding NarL/FixJ family response regulator
MSATEGKGAAMSVRVAVSDPLPIFRRGIMATLGDAGFDPEIPEDLLAWSQERQRRLIFLTLQAAEDWRLLDDLDTSRTDLLVVAVLAEVSTATYVRAILAGAVAAIPRSAPPHLVRRVFDATVGGESLLPLKVVRALASPQLPAGDEGAPSAREIEWLRDLANGRTVAEIAERAGYSERAMFRLLRHLYGRMQVRNRTEALMRAQERGWL